MSTALQDANRAAAVRLSPPVLRKRAKRSERSARGAGYQENGNVCHQWSIIGCKTRGVARSFTTTTTMMMMMMITYGQMWGVPIAIFCYQSTQFMDRQLQHRSRSRDLRRRPKAAIHGRRRPKAAIGQRPRRDRRRPKAGVGACRASRARTRSEAPIQVRKGPFDTPLCVSPLVCPSSDATLLPSSAMRHAMAPLRPAQVSRRLND